MGGTDSMMLSACAESMIVSAPPAASMTLSVPFDCVIAPKAAIVLCEACMHKIMGQLGLMPLLDPGFEVVSS
jgi:hypothetical protein